MTAGGGNARALRRAAKRREALATAHPYITAIVGLADAFLYCNGVLCYTLDDRVRLLDLHNSSNHETVINIPALLTHALSEIEDNRKGIFQILYYADNVTSCLYKSSGPDPAAWLIAFNKNTHRILVTEELASVDKIFVRHNKRYLYYGTHSEIGTDGYKKWVIHGYDFKNRKWYPQKIHLPDMVGSEIGQTICFEFYKDYFYALSNQTSFEVEEIDWTSFYHCVRFPLNCPNNELLEKTEDNSMWRRQHQEGPIDDRWTSLRLDEDETTGELRIVESRKEWYLGSSRSQITYYTTEIIFPEKDYGEEALPYLQDATFMSALDSDTSDAFSSTFASSSTVYAGSYSASASTSSTLPAIPSTTSPPCSPKIYHHDLSNLPDDPILRLLRPDDNPHHIRPPPRLPQNTHPGNDGSHKPTLTLSRSRIRHYHTSASTYLDLVDDPLPSDWQSTQRLRLRAGSRKLGPPLTHPPQSGEKSGLLRSPDPNLPIALKEMYREQPIVYWPPAQDPDGEGKGDGWEGHLNEVYRLLNPPSHLGNVQGTADERSLVYATGPRDKPQAIVFVGFDPGMKLQGLKRWGGLCRKGVGEGPHIGGRATGDVDADGSEYDQGENERRGSGYVDANEADRTVTMDRKGKGKTLCTPVQCEGKIEVDIDLSSEDEGGVGNGMHRSWAWIEKAMWRDIGAGFHFGLPRHAH
jgi:hypothetical protein